MNRVMQRMGNALGQISDRFVDDYTRLVREMDRVVRTSPGRLGGRRSSSREDDTPY